MQPITRHAVTNVNEGAGRCALACDGRPLSASFAGTTLEAQFALANDECVLILSDANPYDAGLHIYLLSNAGTLIDALGGGGAFQPGLFKLHAVQTDSLCFEFFTNDLIYTLTVARKLQMRFVTAAGWRYKNTLKLHRLAMFAAHDKKEAVNEHFLLKTGAQ
jgi:hypothetical protein